MKLENILTKVENHFFARRPFAVFALPEKNDLNCYLQRDATLHFSESLDKRGFLFAPFDGRGSAILIPENNSDLYVGKFQEENIERIPIPEINSPEEKEHHINLVNEAVNVIKNRKASKIVLSRKSEIKIKNFSVALLIKRLLYLYPKAFRYIWFHPETGLWCGATPEVLFKIDNGVFSTMALAGTKAKNENIPPVWTQKEIDEQQFVTDAIKKELIKITSSLKISEPSSLLAGNVYHLKTDFSGVLNEGNNLKNVLEVLHPTPAVCGTPKEVAKNFILENENYNREFYTGFLGPLHQGKSSQLYVNLRCMKIVNNTALLYAGGGITLQSKPETEWEETQQKLKTMRQVLQPFL